MSAEGYLVALRPIALRLPGLEDRGRLEADLTARLVEQAKGAVSARLGTTPDIAGEMLCGLARSQGRELEEYAAAVLAKSGRLDAQPFTGGDTHDDSQRSGQAGESSEEPVALS
jgi:hypothetical protein